MLKNTNNIKKQILTRYFSIYLYLKISFDIEFKQIINFKNIDETYKFAIITNFRLVK